MEKSLTTERLTILYTGGLHGDLAMLPRLYTQLKRLLQIEAPVRTLLLDIGDSCRPSVWHCGATEGRSMIVAFDGMGYDAAHAELTAETRAKLSATARVAVVDQTHTWLQTGICVYSLLAPRPRDSAEPCRLFVCLCDDETQRKLIDQGYLTKRIDTVEQAGNVLYLPPVSAGQVARVRLQLPDVQSFTETRRNQPAGDLPPGWLPKLMSYEVFDLPREMPPDPTIAGVVEFIMSEARYAQKKRTAPLRGSDTDDHH